MLTDAQRILLEDKFVLWDRNSREGNLEMRDYHRRAADALKAALSLASAYSGQDQAGEVEQSFTGLEGAYAALEGEVERLTARVAHLEKSEAAWCQWRDEVQAGWVRSEKEFGEIEGEVERLRSALSEIEASASRGNGPIARDHADDALRTIGLRARAALTPKGREEGNV